MVIAILRLVFNLLDKRAPRFNIHFKKVYIFEN